jgi:hypothetical protein
MRRFVILVPVLLVLTAANDANLGRQRYVPAAGQETATAIFPTGNLRLSIRQGDTQYYGVMAGDTCRSAQRLTIYGAGIGGNTTEDSLPIAAGHRLRILASIQKQTAAGVMAQSFLTCTGVVEFTPVAGATYRITQEADSARPSFCTVAVQESQSGAPPPDLAILQAPRCRFG